MNYNLSRSNRKTMSIIVRDGKVFVKVPLHVSQSVIDSFVLSKSEWIEKKLQMYEAPGFDIAVQDQVRVFGKMHTIVLQEANLFEVVYDSSIEQLVISAPVKLSLESIDQKIENFFKALLSRYLEVRVNYYAELLDLKTPPMKVRRYKRLHGRCSSNGELAFNTYLFHESYEFIDYVVLHECAHLIEFNHSKRFYDIIQKHMPNYKAVIASSKLKDNLHQDL